MCASRVIRHHPIDGDFEVNRVALRRFPARTKLAVPELPSTHVARPGLTARLNDSVADFAVTFVAGFAGSGKTVGLAEWARSRPAGQVAWLSCDITDADPIHFWTALIAALRTLDPDIGDDALDLLDSDGHLSYDAVASIVNELIDRDAELELVIDDLHFIARSALESLAELVDRLPSNTRVILSARSDPRLPLHRWRAAGRLGEVRAAELRLTTSEVGQLVANVGVEISGEDAEVLATRTEGWAAGVLLAALSMRHETAPAAFIHNFAGTDRNVADFLVGEVLRRQPDDTVTFLLETSVLDELSAPFCDALTGRSGSGVMLADLERENLFVIPLDNEQTLYRYHHLFAELLRKLLAARHPERTLELHRVASAWYAQHDDPRRAVRHAILARDPMLVTSLVRGGVLAGFFTGSGEMVREWINDLSRASIDMPPELTIEYALALGLAGGFEDARAWLERAQGALADDAPPTVRARLAMARAITIGSVGEIEPAMEAAYQARSYVERGTDPLIDTGSRHVLLRGTLFTGDFAAARALLEEDRRQPGDPEQLDRVIFGGMFSQVELESGELEAARVAAERSVAAVAKLDAEGHLGTNDAFRTLGALAYEADHLDEAEALFERCVALVWSGRPVFMLLARIELARIWNARGEIEAAFVELDRARDALPAGIQSPLIDRVEGYRARLLTESGNIAAGREIVAQLPTGRLRSVAEIRLHLAEKNATAAHATLEPLAGSNHTRREELEFAVLDARVALDLSAAEREEKLELVLVHGRSAGFIRTIADEGPVLAPALAETLRRQPADSYTDALAPVLERTIAAGSARNVPLFGGVMLSERELTVLKYLATRLATREIAAELYVSMNTFRTHTKSIYRKLAVDSRAGAVAAARGLGIL
jgi:LuxR family maltose regulon positive regulatory protein